MRLKDIVITEGPMGVLKNLSGIDRLSDIKAGYDAISNPIQKIKSKLSQDTPTAKKRKTPFDNLDPREFKKILDSVLNNKPLDARQQQILKTLYRNL